MVSRKLNRIFTIKTRQPSVTAPTRFVYGTPHFTSNQFPDGGWYHGDPKSSPRQPPRQAMRLGERR